VLMDGARLQQHSGDKMILDAAASEQDTQTTQ
jgi:hypothetical protein